MEEKMILIIVVFILAVCLFIGYKMKRFSDEMDRVFKDSFNFKEDETRDKENPD